MPIVPSLWEMFLLMGIFLVIGILGIIVVARLLRGPSSRRD